MITASGPVSTLSSFSDTFDGTNHGELPQMLDIDRLTGGSFNASFRFATVTPPAGGQTTVYYDLTGTSATMTFDLFDSSGQLVHHGSDSPGAEAIVSNNHGGAPFTVDQVLVAGIDNSISGSQLPAAIYTPPGETIVAADFSFFSYVGNGVDYLTDLSIPTDAAIYMAFPNKVFDVYIFFGDGDIANFAEPYQYAELSLAYEITTLTVTPVPEAGLVSLLIPAMSMIGLRRRS